MCDTRGFDHTRLFQHNLLGAEMIEQSDTFTEQYGHKVNHHLIDKSGFDALLRHICAAHEIDVLLARRLLSLLYGALDTVGDERERGRTLWNVLRDIICADPGSVAAGC
jgi:hypothetical protein